MFNRAIFKQTVKANRTLFFIITAVLTMILVLIIFNFDPSSMQQLMNTIQGSGAFGDMETDGLLSSSITILGILSQSFYTMIAIIVMLVFIIITANNLIAGEVDRGSMAYTLSTPIKRTSVIFTKAVYLIASLFIMVTIFTLAGVTSIQIKYQLIWGTSYTSDIKEMAKQSDYSKEQLENDFNIIITDKDLLSIGAKKRAVSNETYEMYIKIKTANKGLEASAAYLKMDMKDIDYDKILASSEALKAGSDASNMDLGTYTMLITMLRDAGSSEGEGEGGMDQEVFQETFTQIYEAMGMKNITEAIASLEKILEKPDIIIAKSVENGLKPLDVIMMIKMMSVNQLISADNSISFDTWAFIKINLGLFLLMFAISGISFIASSIFNLSKNSFALGAGLPLAFWVLQIVSNIDESLEFTKYFSLNTLFNPNKLMKSSNPFVLQFIALFVIGSGLYVASVFIFKKKDLPL